MIFIGRVVPALVPALVIWSVATVSAENGAMKTERSILPRDVCCSAGTQPQANPDGSCASYTVDANDSCKDIAVPRSLTADDLEVYNNNTWGWSGCDNLQAGAIICVSDGSPPMPAPIENAVCGPQVPGTIALPPGSNFSTLNPCPLNACCNVRGQCGITAAFCTPSGTGPPGTARPGTDGCISNCRRGFGYTDAPSEFKRIAYFDAFNTERPCLNMDVTQVDKTQYSHLHFAFANLTADFQVEVDPVQDQFQEFTQMTDIKRILSIGGWAFSSSPETYMIWRNGVAAANRQTLAQNIANFIRQNNLDGADIDWEYPGASGIQGVPAGAPTEGGDYAVFLQLLKGLLQDKSVSITAPASYELLKQFPIKDISNTVDYIVYMTYDLHGQWDYGNSKADSGCPMGNCLRSHVNGSETWDALSMIAQAGVPENKVIVGVPSYGRTFKMTDPDCSGPMCTYVGPESAAKTGRCTGTAGILAKAEIDEIIAANDNIQQFVDVSDSNVLIYDSDQYVSYMNDDKKAWRTEIYKSGKFGGTSDWTVDMQKFLSKGQDPATGPVSRRSPTT
ncbi:glycoside hydrolase superfamily [Hypoxylon sp. NC1633]|nr:glycoside hydrolase superfamily [Hypoxylon sp. NC1633]